MISSGIHGMRNYLLFRYPLLRPIFHWVWFRMKKGQPIEGVNLEEARVIKKAVSVPVICTGGFQTASFIREAISSGGVDAVSIARSLVANNDLVHQWAAGADRPEKPCTYCNRCLVSAMKNPMGCYDVSRYPNREAMIDAVMSVYRVHGEMVTPTSEVMSR
jgi:tRNA-dihydrouridine synthase